MYHTVDVQQNYHTAVKWHAPAAEQGYGDAQFDLSVMYDKGQGVLCRIMLPPVCEQILHK